MSESENNESLYPQANQPEPPRIVILISGGGSNMLTIAKAVKEGIIDAEVSAVMSNRPNAGGLQKAADLDIHTDIVDHTLYPDRKDFDTALLRQIEEYQPDLIVLAGFMRILTPEFVRYFEGRLINIHPSLLPKYQGLHTHKRAIEAGDDEHGATVHFVTEELDGGPSIIQAVVPVLSSDTEEALQQRVLEQEHIIYPIAVKWFAEGRLKMKGNEVFMDNEQLPSTGVQLRSQEH